LWKNAVNVKLRVKHMSNKNATDTSTQHNQVTRRELMASGAAVAAAALALAGTEVRADVYKSKKPLGNPPKAPFDSLRDFVDALDQHGLLQRFSGVDQDKYEATAIIYQLIDQFGVHGAPAVWFDDITANGKSFTGPVVSNLQGHWDAEAILWNLPRDPYDPTAAYRAAKQMHFERLEKTDGGYTLIEPHEVTEKNAPVKQVKLTGKDVDVTSFPFFRGNPGDGGPYINTASVFTKDPDLGVNLGTYRCQVKGPRKIMVNFESGQTGIRMVNAAKERGETTIPVTLVVGQDPITWMVSSSRIPNRIGNRKPIDELAVAGGLRGKAVDVVRTENGEFLVPAQAEIVIEGTVDIINLEPEGPYHEMYGYMGIAKDKNYVLSVDTVTHRKNPWVMNSFTGVISEYISAPQTAASIYSIRKSFPNVVDYHSPHDSQGLVYISIKKDAVGQGIKVAEPLAKFNPLARVVIVVDDDIDVMDSAAVRFAVGSRWHPSTASQIFDGRRAFPLDPAAPDRKTTSKIIIDATRQWPEEGGPPFYQELNRAVFEKAAPGAIARVTARWPEQLLAERRF
jgi:4-hydroxy-3-polyprenylbenzoate decarboxylase